MSYLIKKIYNPSIFQGHKKKNKYFEGWYFKLVDDKEENIYAIIPGVSVLNDKEKSHAFIQIIDGKNNNSHYIKYDINKFKYSIDEFEIYIENNYFSKDKIILDINNNDMKLNGKLEFKNIATWPSKLTSPSIMGPFSFIPFMECYHGVISLNHNIYGSLAFNDKKIDFDNGIGYIEKDWGRSFPSSWIWLQCNHFDIKNTSLTLSIANIPFLTSSFKGFIIGFLYNNKLYRFATYTNAKIKKIDYTEKNIYIEIEDNRHRLIVECDKSNTGLLYSPKNGNMTGKVNESISSQVHIILYDKIKNTKIFEGSGRNAGLELML